MKKKRNTAEKIIGIIIGILYVGVAIAWEYLGIRWAHFDVIIEQPISYIMICMVPATIYLVLCVVGIVGIIKRKYWGANGIIGLIFVLFFSIYGLLMYAPGFEFLHLPYPVTICYTVYFEIRIPTILSEIVILVLLKIAGSLKKKQA